MRKGCLTFIYKKKHCRAGYRSSFALQIMTTEDRLISPTTDMLFLYIIVFVYFLLQMYGEFFN